MDAFLYERGHSLLERAEGVSLARASGIGVWPYIGVYNNWPRTIYNNTDYQQEIFTTAMFGGAPIIAQPYGYVEHKENRRFVSLPFSVLKEHEKELLGFENEPYVAVVYGYQNPPGHPRSGWFWKTDARSCTLGAFAACLYGHVQVSSVPDRLLDEPEKLGRYRVVYLADTAYLSERRVRNLKRFVEDGGGLVVSYATSLYDAEGRRRGQFALEELIRVKPARQEGKLSEILKSYQSMLGGPNDLYLMGKKDGRLIPLWYFQPVEALEGGEPVMDIVTGDGRRPVLPGVVVSKHGKGRVVYSASSLEGLYLEENGAIVGDFVKRLIGMVAAEAAPYETDAPASVVFNLTGNGDRRVLHITNWTGNFERGGGFLAPVENIHVKLRGPRGKQIDRVWTFGEDRGQSGLSLTFRRIEAYQGVLLELK